MSENQTTEPIELAVGQVWTPRKTGARPKIIVKMSGGSSIYTASWPRVKSKYGDQWTLSTDSKWQMRWWIEMTDAHLTDVVENPDG